MSWYEKQPLISRSGQEKKPDAGSWSAEREILEHIQAYADHKVSKFILRPLGSGDAEMQDQTGENYRRRTVQDRPDSGTLLNPITEFGSREGHSCYLLPATRGSAINETQRILRRAVTG
ncbi:MAG: hypothetical protein CM1200mP20_00940 [Pseudomonadota bacterium]|nr:MAG: hypothetical protein CM1200mP20_00940 [Pseudomonadota bacterium]